MLGGDQLRARLRVHVDELGEEELDPSSATARGRPPLSVGPPSSCCISHTARSAMGQPPTFLDLVCASATYARTRRRAGRDAPPPLRLCTNLSSVVARAAGRPRTDVVSPHLSQLRRARGNRFRLRRRGRPEALRQARRSASSRRTLLPPQRRRRPARVVVPPVRAAGPGSSPTATRPRTRSTGWACPPER